MVGSSDLIGEAVLTLPDLGALLQSGTRRSELPPIELRHPPASHPNAKKSLAGKLVGSISGFVELSESSGGGGGGGGGGAPSAKLVAMQTEIDAKAREIVPLTPTPTPTLTQPQPQPQP